MRVEVVISGVECERAVDFEEGLGVLIGLLDEPKIHLADAGLGGLESRTEFRVEHQSLAAVFARLVAGGHLARGLARKFESEGRHAVGSTGIQWRPYRARIVLDLPI
jgi:hypothetical protein